MGFSSVWAEDDRGSVFLAAVVGAAISIAISGFLFPTGNQLFYYAIISNISSEPQFANDVFANSLPHFSSGLWLALRGTPRYIDPYWMVLGLLVLSRLLNLLGALSCARLLGLKSFPQLLLFSIIFSASFLMSNFALGGFGGLFINTFTHSEVGNGLFLLCIAAAVRQKVALSVIILGLIFFFNAFFAVWVAPLLCIVLAIQWLRGETPISRLLIQGLAGAAIALVIAMPVVLSVARNRGYGAATDFDYLEYLKQYYPYHFLFSSLGLGEKIGLAAIAIMALISFTLLGGPARYFLAVTIGAIGVYVIGIFVPAFTHSPAILNLHLLRSSVMIQLLCATSLSALAAKWWFDDDKVNAFFRGPVLAFLLTFPTLVPELKSRDFLYYPVTAVLFVFLLAVMAAPRFGEGVSRRFSVSKLRVSRIAVVGWLVFAVSFQAVATQVSQRAERETISDWEQVAEWAKANTPADSIFLNSVGEGSAVFDSVAHRVVWVDWKRGGAVMWYPSYYKVWRQRMLETHDLGTLEARLAYSASHQIAYVIDSCRPGQATDGGAPPVLAFSAGKLCVYRVGAGKTL